MAAEPRYIDLLARLDGAAGALGVELGLDRIQRALGRLGDPQRRFLSVQIAGTNGKGSTAAMTDAILRRAGLRTGLYTSPHLARFTERIRIDGREVDGDHLAALDVRVQASGERLTYFEIATVLGLLAFAEAGVQAAVLETGLGGRLDAVTCCEPLVTAITSIGLDHTDYLGPTLTDVAREKAGILKPGVPCVLGPLPPEAEAAIAARAREVGAPLRHLHRSDRNPERVPWTSRDDSAGQSPAPSTRDVPAAPGHLSLVGTHQRDNAAIAVALARAVAERAGRPLADDEIGAALAGVRWPGRLERLAEDLWVDAAHNADGARALAAALPEIAAGRPVTLVMSVARDKDLDAMLAALAPRAVRLIATRNDSPRALPAAALAEQAAARFGEVLAVDDPWEALARARAAGGVVLVCGSIFLVGPLRARLLGEPVDPRRTSDPLAPEPAGATSPRR